MFRRKLRLLCACAALSVRQRGAPGHAHPRGAQSRKKAARPAPSARRGAKKQGPPAGRGPKPPGRLFVLAYLTATTTLSAALPPPVPLWRRKRAAGPGLCAPCRLPRGQARSRKSAHSKNPRPRVPGLGVLLSSGRGPVALFSAVRGFAQKSKAHPAVCAKPKPTSLAGGCPAMGFMLPSSATAGGLQSLHGHRAPDDWLVGFNVGATNRTGQAVAVFRARRRAGRPVKKRGGGAPRRVTARYRTALPGARQTPRSPRPALHHPLQCPKTLRRFLPSRA